MSEDQNLTVQHQVARAGDGSEAVPTWGEGTVNTGALRRELP